MTDAQHEMESTSMIHMCTPMLTPPAAQAPVAGSLKGARILHSNSEPSLMPGSIQEPSSFLGNPRPSQRAVD